MSARRVEFADEKAKGLNLDGVVASPYRLSPWALEAGLGASGALQPKASITRRIREQKNPHTISEAPLPEIAAAKETRARQNILAPEMPREKQAFFQPWRWYWKTVTCCFPSFCLSRCLGMTSKPVPRLPVC